jgi:SAM-dependent methyltransferase
VHGISAIDHGKKSDWGKTSTDYAAHRPGPPERFYRMLGELGIGLRGQAMLDLGTGTGLLARRFAAQGAVVAGIDIAENQIATARALAASDRVEVDFRVSSAEATPFPDKSFDVITASQCWLYFDPDRAGEEVKRLLRPGGVLVTTHFSWLPRFDPIARASEQLVRKYNPAWSAFDWSGDIPAVPEWSVGRFSVAGMFWFDEAVPFTRADWQGRIRACRGVGATMDATAISAFDREHGELLSTIAGDTFTIQHRIDAHIFKPLT